MTEKKQVKTAAKEAKNSKPAKSDKPSKAEVTKSPVPAKGASRFSVFILFVLILLCIAALGYAYFDIQKYRQQQVQQLATLQQHIKTLQENNRQDQLEVQIQQLQQALQQSRQQNQHDLQLLAEKVQKQGQQLYLKQKSWIYSDIHYLLKLAARRLTLVGDTHGAIAALTAADEAIRKIENASLIKLRKTIMDTINQLQQVNLPDIEGLLIRLDRIRLDMLKARYETQSLPPAEEAEKQTANRSLSWKQQFLAFFSKLVVIKDKTEMPKALQQQEEDIKALTDADQYNRVMLTFENLKQAILQGNQQHYDAYLAKLLTLVTRQDILERLQALKNQKVMVSFPDATLPLQEYETFLRQMQQQQALTMEAK